MTDNLLYSTESLRSSVTALKKKLSNLRISFEALDSEISKIESKFDKLLVQSEIYKSKVEREANRRIRKLELEIEAITKEYESNPKKPLISVNESELSIASTVAVFESILRHMCVSSEDFKLMSYSILFPSVYERLIQEDETLYLKEVPVSASIVVKRGKQFISSLRSEFETHVTDPQVWGECIGHVSQWWINDALPLLYGQRHEDWETEVPLDLREILMWKEEPSERPINFPSVFDTFEIYKLHKDQVFESSGVRAFDLQLFSFREPS